MRRNRGLIGAKSDVTASDATGIFDTFDAYNAKRNGIWPGGGIVTDNLVLNLDSSDSNSYGGSGTTWSDVSGQGNNFTINGPTYASIGGYIEVFADNDYYSIPTSSNFAFGTGDFTIEFMFNQDASRSYARAVQFGPAWSSGSDSVGVTLSSSRLDFYARNITTSMSMQSSTTISNGQWYHAAITRSNGIFRLFLDGVLESTNSSYTTSSTESSSTNTCFIGGNGSSLEEFDGKIKNIRVVKGTALYTSSFTAPTESLNKVSGTVLLTAQGSSLSDQSDSNHTLTANGNAAYEYNAAPYFNFDGSNDYVTKSNFMGLGGQNRTVTVECGFYMPSSGGGYMVCNERSGLSAGQGWYYISPSECYFEQHSTTSFPYVYKCTLSATGLNNLNTDGWNIISYSVDVSSSNTMSCDFMLNGHTETVTNSSVSWGSQAWSDDNVDIGRRKNSSYSTDMFDGRINSVRIYDTNLSSTQQLQNWNALKGRFGL